MVMRLHLEGEIPLVIECDDSGVIDKRGAKPRLAYAICRRPDVRIEKTVNRLRDGRGVRRRAMLWTNILNLGLECFVNAVFAPRLSEHFEFDIRWVARFIHIIGTNGLHFRQVERETAVSTH